MRSKSVSVSIGKWFVVGVISVQAKSQTTTCNRVYEILKPVCKLGPISRVEVITLFSVIFRWTFLSILINQS